LDEIRDLKQKLDQLKQKAVEARSKYDLATAADIEYFAIPNTEEKIANLTAEKQKSMMEGTQETDQLLSEVVRPEQIMEVVS
jgi:ATP-dependent Clp protease ATP-binding subunit ClpB